MLVLNILSKLIFLRIKFIIDSKRAQLERCLNSPDSIKEEENELREKLCEVAKKRARAVLRFQVGFKF